MLINSLYYFPQLWISTFRCLRAKLMWHIDRYRSDQIMVPILLLKYGNLKTNEIAPDIYSYFSPQKTFSLYFKTQPEYLFLKQCSSTYAPHCAMRDCQMCRESFWEIIESIVSINIIFYFIIYYIPSSNTLPHLCPIYNLEDMKFEENRKITSHRFEKQ